MVGDGGYRAGWETHGRGSERLEVFARAIKFLF
jgi:hypothetical protein